MAQWMHSGGSRCGSAALQPDGGVCHSCGQHHATRERSPTAMMSFRPAAPRLESDLMRDPRLGYEPSDSSGFIRCIEHGFPTPLARWHYHEEYELQLILATHGRAYVGDYIGDYQPGHLVLTGPRLPHNWIATEFAPQGERADRLVIQFQDGPLRRGLEVFRELGDVETLLDNARYGIEFFGMGEVAREHFHRIRQSRGSRRLAEFVMLLSDLAACDDHRLLSTSPVRSRDEDPTMERLNKVVEYVNAHYTEAIDMQAVYGLTGMSQSTFSRCFSRATGSTFTDFVNRFRIGKACELLMHTDRPVAKIAFDVGFNNLANFNRRFAAVKGMTPTEFRRRGVLRYGAAEAAGPLLAGALLS
jgi:AraC-like DNA-binding protein